MISRDSIYGQGSISSYFSTKVSSTTCSRLDRSGSFEHPLRGAAGTTETFRIKVADFSQTGSTVRSFSATFSLDAVSSFDENRFHRLQGRFRNAGRRQETLISESTASEIFGSSLLCDCRTFRSKLISDEPFPQAVSQFATGYLNTLFG